MSILNTAPQAVQSAAGSARGSIIDFGAQALKLINNLRRDEYELVGSALQRVGLQRRQSSFRSVGWLAAGALIGGSAVLLLSPGVVSGMRRRVGSFLETVKGAEEKVTTTIGTSLTEVERSAADSVGAGVDAMRAAAKQSSVSHGRS